MHTKSSRVRNLKVHAVTTSANKARTACHARKTASARLGLTALSRVNALNPYVVMVTADLARISPTAATIAAAPRKG